MKGGIEDANEPVENQEPVQEQIGPTIVIEPSKGWSSLGLGDIWVYRELMYFLVWRDTKARYRQMAFGPLWIILQPLIQMVLFTIVFGQLAKLPSEGIPYPVFTYVALLPWLFFADGVRRSSRSLVEQKGIISKVYFPRLVIPLAAVVSSLIDFLVSLVILFGMVLVFDVSISPAILTLPIFLLLAMATAIAVGLWSAGLTVKFRDVELGIASGLEVWKFLTPVAYSATLVPERWQIVYSLNPMYTVVEGFRWSILKTEPHFGWTSVVSTFIVLTALISGAFLFRRSERSIVDLI